MSGSRGSALGSETEGTLAPTEDSLLVVGRVVETIEDSLVESLGLELALAVRTCLSTSLALSDPRAYVTALEVMVGNDRAQSVLECAGKRLHELERELRPTGSTSFTESILALRSRYSPRVLRNSE